jgi:hypothetical protein
MKEAKREAEPNIQSASLLFFFLNIANSPERFARGQQPKANCQELIAR